MTPGNCRICHEAIYDQFVRSRHAAPSWVAVAGNKDFSPAMISQMEKLHPGSMERSAHPLTKLEGESSTTSGCIACHSIGKPNSDGTIGNCTDCHTRHTSSVAVARLPSTCGQCHLGPDHSQMEIYTESKHGIMFAAQKNLTEFERAAGYLDDQGHVRSHLRHLPHERDQRPGRHARPIRAVVV